MASATSPVVFHEPPLIIIYSYYNIIRCRCSCQFHVGFAIGVVGLFLGRTGVFTHPILSKLPKKYSIKDTLGQSYVIIFKETKYFFQLFMLQSSFFNNWLKKCKSQTADVKIMHSTFASSKCLIMSVTS